MVVLYNLFIQILWWAIKVYSFFNPKAQMWIQGRKNWKLNLKKNVPRQGKIVWIHCASLGEFEQGRPIVENLKQSFPEYFVLLTFYSPSGYEIRKDYSQADYITYLPLDTPSNAEYFVSTVKPQWAIFIKYEFWYQFLHTLNKYHIPTFLVAAVFRPNQIFFKWYGGFFRQIPFLFTEIFVQNAKSKDLLQKIGYLKTTVLGDTRIDRVIAIANQVQPDQRILEFIGKRKVLIAGSSWPPEEKILLHWIEKVNLKEWCLILAPHQVTPQHIQKIKDQFKHYYLTTYTQGINSSPSDILLIDTIGILSGLYQVGTIAFIGGGFGKSIHNILEPAAFSIPIIFGPNHHKFIEAQTLIATKGAFEVKNELTFNRIFVKLSQKGRYEKAQKAVHNYIQEGKGATAKLIHYLIKQR
ncbi:MAG: hypothetical protein RLZZ248_1925 [Bacteroidota bacterium]|jgi:3-deoxy-D-manno-octulosonic-acid transferase